MSSIKLFKKEINNSIGSYIEEVYAWELNHPDANLKSTEQLIDKAIALFDDLIEKIHFTKERVLRMVSNLYERKWMIQLETCIRNW